MVPRAFGHRCAFSPARSPSGSSRWLAGLLGDDDHQLVTLLAGEQGFLVERARPARGACCLLLQSTGEQSAKTAGRDAQRIRLQGKRILDGPLARRQRLRQAGVAQVAMRGAKGAEQVAQAEHVVVAPAVSGVGRSKPPGSVPVSPRLQASTRSRACSVPADLPSVGSFVVLFRRSANS
jgi:hypothetical protein